MVVCSLLLSPAGSVLSNGRCGDFHTQRVPISYCLGPSEVHKTLEEAAASYPIPLFESNVLS